MGRFDDLHKRILWGGSDANIRFADLRRVLSRLGFTERVRGSHHIFTRDDVPEILNLQPRSDGKAKVYQVRQIRTILRTYGPWEPR